MFRLQFPTSCSLDTTGILSLTQFVQNKKNVNGKNDEIFSTEDESECCKVITIKYDSLPMAISETFQNKVVYYAHLCAHSFTHWRRKLLTLPKFGSLHLLLSSNEFYLTVFLCGNFDFSNENFHLIIFLFLDWPTRKLYSFNKLDRTRKA